MVVESTEVRLAGDIQIRKLPSRVQTLERVAPDVTVIKLQLPASEQFRYYAGQYIEVILKDGRRRSYSMAGAPHTGSPLELHIRHMPGGVFTDHVFGAGETQMKEREILRLEGPFGSFFLREDSDKPIVLLASGTGFAPVKAIVEHMIHKNIKRPVALYWGGAVRAISTCTSWRSRGPSCRRSATCRWCPTPPGRRLDRPHGLRAPGRPAGHRRSVRPSGVYACARRWMRTRPGASSAARTGCPGRVLRGRLHVRSRPGESRVLSNRA